MRIAWGTPFNERSAIARYSLFVARELARRGMDVEILRLEFAEALELPLISHEFKAHHPDRMLVAVKKGEFDAVVLNFGDHLPFHGSVEKVLFGASFVAIFHDAVADSLAWGAADRNTDLGRFLGATDRNSHLGALAALAHGSVVHGQHYFAEVSESCPGPTACIPLCYPDIGALDPQDRSARDEFVVVTFGMINPNKQPDRILRALALSGKLATSRVRFVGPVEDSQRSHLLDLAASLGLPPPEFTGWVSDETLCLALSGADAICCLRYPVSEGGSASLISALYSARPLIVPDVATYADLPNCMAWKVPYGDSPEPVARALEEIANDRGRAHRRALGGREWARARYSATAYVDLLLPHLGKCLQARPVMEAGRQLGLTLASLGIRPEAAYAERLACALDFMW
jgi:glycosyltransferase involved in cell wall biosynthesis